ncbi:MAG: bifunctional 23S rRNA (guanine(2069)-N(7))-methyltransferase RlmK/23S rRNA (guanine(2445)-N(2))-methyltransferase RlmL [Coriobacteriales bacterium]|jgi:23S rRNA (guanine2445-N2)-methyltransferase / 23S rRNA (guanine2069-N7)-methyltransferase
MEFFATCAGGLEKVLGDELRKLGVPRVRPLTGGVSFQGGLEDAYRALLWSRVASRVLLTLARIDASDADALYEGINAIDWGEHIAPGRTIAVTARGVNGALHDTRFTALKAKDAVVDRLREVHGTRPDVEVKDPDVRINVIVRHEKATVSIDLAGTPLEQRGYRVRGKAHGAPLHENAAAALLLEAGWPELSSAGAVLVNPFCASGTLAIEAGLIAADVAPGILRSKWGFFGWSGHNELVWNGLVDEADARAEASEHKAQVMALDADLEALDYAAACARRAGLGELVSFSGGLKADALASMTQGALVACRIPDDLRAASVLPQAAGEVMELAARSGASRLALIAGDSRIDAFVGADPALAHTARLGKEEGAFRVYGLESPAASLPVQQVEVGNARIPVADAGAQQFASRLQKVFRTRRKWAEREGIHAYRVYDADLPDFKFAIDVYEGAGPDEGSCRVHVAEYAAPKEIDPSKAARRLTDAVRIIPEVLGVRADDVYVKQRLRSRGGSQYALKRGSAAGPSTPPFVTRENGLLFEVNLGDYLDTGLFLDQRLTRALIAALSKGKSFLNLFSYTGTASVYAAAGGAQFTTTVDLSNTYLDWARRNMELNGLMNRDQHFERADVLSWIKDMRHSKNRWDFVYVDPPTFSNSAKMGGHDWDVQRDHAQLLIDVSRVLRRGGVALFSCNLKNFKLDIETLAKAGVRAVDITPKTIPEDFVRTPKVHHCYLLKR